MKWIGSLGNRPGLIAVGLLALPALGMAPSWLLPSAEAGDAATDDAVVAAAATLAAAAPAAPEVVAPTVSHELDASLEPLRGEIVPGAAWDPAAAPFEVRVEGETVRHSVLALQVLPGQSLWIEAEGADAVLRHRSGRVEPGAEDGAETAAWRWVAPDDPGVAPLVIARVATGETVALNVLVAHPATEVRDGRLEGYRIGRYKERPLRGDPTYLPPTGFVAVAPEDEDILVTPHLRLGQFLCKQPGDPRFVHLSLPLLHKLESVLEAVNEEGYPASTFHIMSGFRTPAYNLSIGNKTVYSRHLWGDAADVWVDEDGDGDMDDWNGDGVSDIRDARILSGIVSRLEAEQPDEARPGGVGLYRRNAAHGPFVHVDARGYPARW